LASGGARLYLLAQAVIIESASIDTAKNTSNLPPIAAVVLTFAWTRAYGERAGQRGERLSKEEGASR
jgi:hypothetical protein